MFNYICFIPVHTEIIVYSASAMKFGKASIIIMKIMLSSASQYYGGTDFKLVSEAGSRSESGL